MQKKFKISAGNKVMVGIPKEYPTDMVEELREEAEDISRYKIRLFVMDGAGENGKLFTDTRCRRKRTALVPGNRTNLHSVFKR